MKSTLASAVDIKNLKLFFLITPITKLPIPIQRYENKCRYNTGYVLNEILNFGHLATEKKCKSQQRCWCYRKIVQCCPT